MKPKRAGSDRSARRDGGDERAGNVVLSEEPKRLEETEELKELERQEEDWLFWGGGCMVLPNSLNMPQAH